MPDAALALERQGPVARLWLDRPQCHNAFDADLVARMTETLRVLDDDPEVRVVVLGGRGSSFCAGADLDWMRTMATQSYAENLRDAEGLAEMLHTLAYLSKPTIARVHGAALAGGAGLVAACDIAVATPQARFGVTEVRLGLIPATISPYLIRAIGARAAQRWILTGERFDAATARELGLLHLICAESELDVQLEALCDGLLRGAPEAQAAAKRLVELVVDEPITPELIADTSQRIAQARASAEAREGMAAFFDKRPAAWVRKCSPAS